jgi:hypothetical protein
MYKGEFMGKYFKLDLNNKLENIIVAEKDFIQSQPDKEKYFKMIETSEEEYIALNNLDTTYSLNFGNIGEEFNYQKRKFKNPQPYPSWKWNEKKYEWEAPFEKPKETTYIWNEEKKVWEFFKIKDCINC